MSRQDKVQEFGLAIVEADEKYWAKQGYKIDYKTNRLIKI